jgi:putative mycofactocin binding protein MftB
MSEARYRLAPGTQVRQEDFGLLFYTMKGPRLYFLSSGPWLSPDFFDGAHPLFEQMARHSPAIGRKAESLHSVGRSLGRQLARLCEKGVIVEC